MSRIPFIHAAFPDPAFSKPAIEKRLKRHSRHLAARKAGLEAPLPDDDADDRAMKEGITARIDIPWRTAHRISRRAEAISACFNRKSPLSRLKPEDRKRLEVLRDGVDLVVLPSEHRADEIAAALHAEMPWMAAATTRIWQDLQQSVQRGEPGTHILPQLFDGPPGIGKSYLARLLAKLIGVPGLTLEATVENASFGLVGSQRGWGNAAPGRMINLILGELVGNPVIFIDEVEKAGRADSTKGQSFSLTDALLPLLEPTSARAWTCPYHEIAFDMSWISWVLASNDWRSLPAPLISRCPPIRLERPTVPHLKGFARHQGARRGLSEASVEAICEALDRATARGYVPDLRTVLRMLDHAERMERRPPLQ
ncbi:AAA family ATPase [Cereibacter sphaeroides]|uniref:AAA family ATPase n=1 Tax=Cereibacter sphaeroides TaxID=1063 RepID=UPI001F38166C|nr:AAA family ATPase [Cereibacter sphaeroides]MCE6968812.1 AAA family ATPase [Cereibacter sphaeroides]